MKKTRSMFLALISVLLAPMGANADLITWTLNEVLFNDGGTATGSFVFDAASGLYSDISITTAGGTAKIVGSGGAGTGPVWPGATYASSADSLAYPSRVLVATELADLSTLPGTISANSGLLFLTFASALTDAGGTINIINDVIVDLGGGPGTVFSGEATCNAFPSSTGCISYAPFRDIVSGYVTAGETPSCEFGGTYPDCAPPPTTVPEPGTLALFGIGLLGMAAARRRKV